MQLKKEEIQSALHAGVCSVTFTKVNGDERVMAATLKAELLPAVVEKVLAEGETPPAPKKPNPNVLRFMMLITLVGDHSVGTLSKLFKRGKQ